MRLTSLVRRSVAVTAATALMSGGLASGLIATPASAAPLPTPTLTSVSPSQWDNRSTATFTLTGGQFFPGDTVNFHPCDVQPWTSGEATHTGCKAFVPGGHEVDTFSKSIEPGAPAATTATVKPNLAMAPPGSYFLTVEHGDGTESSVSVNPDGTPKVLVRIFDIGAANVRGMAAGVNNSGGTCDPFDIRCDRGDRPIDLTGSNFAIGADVQFLKADGAPDAGIEFKPGNPGNGENTTRTTSETGYPSTTLIQGNYSADPDLSLGVTPGFAPGQHLVRVTNTYRSVDGPKNTGRTVDMWMPWFRLDAVTVDTPSGLEGANSVGAGAQGVAVTVKGRGFREGMTLGVGREGITAYPDDPRCGDVTTVGPFRVTAISPPDANGNDSVITGKINVAACTNPTDSTHAPRSVTVSDPSGVSWARNAMITINPRPVVDDGSPGATLGQGASQQPATIDGSGFEQGETCATFDFGPGVTATPVSCSATSASVLLDIAQDAPVGERSVTVTNPSDKGSSTTEPAGPLVPLTIVAGPKVKTVSPASIGSNEPDPGQTITVKGTGFEDGMFVEFFADANLLQPYPGLQSHSPSVTQGASGADDTLTFKITTVNAPKGLPSMVVTNPGPSHGRFVCTCIGIDSLDVSPDTASNAGSSGPLTLTDTDTLDSLHLGDTVGPNSTATLLRTVSVAGQGPITGTLPAKTGADTAVSTFDLTHSAPGAYNMVFVSDSSSAASPRWSCTGCFTVTAAGVMTVSGISPNEGGRGATDLPVTVSGSNFSQGTSVVIDEVVVHDVTFVNPTTITAKVDIPSGAATGAQTVTVTPPSGDAQTTTFTVNPAPAPTSVTPASRGQGAGTTQSGSSQTFRIDGTGFQNDPGTKVTASGTGVTVTITTITEDTPPRCLLQVCTGGSAGHIEATIAVAEDATPGKRDITVKNADGGSGTLTGGFTVNPGPHLATVANESGQPILFRDGQKHTISFFGSGFPSPATDEEKSAAFKITNVGGSDATDITVENRQFAPGKITADVTVAPSRPYGAVRVAIFNAPDKGFTECLTCLAVANVPGVPGNLTLVPGASSLKATWTAPADNGAPITAYRVTIQRVGTALITPYDLSGTTLTKTFTSLANGASYVVKVNAVNAAGAGLPASKTGIPGIVTKLTSVVSTKLTTAGSPVKFGGRLMAGTSPVVNRYVDLRFTPRVGSPFTRRVLTNSTGNWSYRFVTVYTFSMRASFAVDNVYRAATTTAIPVSVRARVLRTAPASGSTSSATSVLKIAGNVYPNKRGKYVYLYRFLNGTKTLVSRTVLTSSSTFVFTGKPRRGTYTYRVYIANTTGNLANYSAAFTIRRV